MTDDTTQPATITASALRAKTAALCGIGLMVLALAALMFTLSFDALSALAIEIGVRPQRAWMAPVAIDVAQAAATLCLVVIGVADKYAAARRYCMALATGTVLLSVAGNGYHAYQLAERNIARVAAGEDLGFIPQPPAIAALMATIFPLLWLALFHLINVVIRVIRDDRAAFRGQTRASATVRADRSTLQGTVDAPVHDDRIAVAAPPAPSPVPAVAAARPMQHRHVVARPVAAPARTPQRPAATPATAATVLAEKAATATDRTRSGYAQTVDGLDQFLGNSDLSEAVKRVAATRIANPGFNQVQVAQEMNLDKSTVSRHWRVFSDAAKSEGFTVPPLPQPFGATSDLQPDRELQPA
jgi:hypothetical protein